MCGRTGRRSLEHSAGVCTILGTEPCFAPGLLNPWLELEARNDVLRWRVIRSSETSETGSTWVDERHFSQPQQRRQQGLCGGQSVARGAGASLGFSGLRSLCRHPCRAKLGALVVPAAALLPGGHRAVQRGLHGVDLTKDRQQAFERLGRGLALAGIDAEDPFDWDGKRSPREGLPPGQSDSYPSGKGGVHRRIPAGTKELSRVGGVIGFSRIEGLRKKLRKFSVFGFGEVP